MGLISILVVSAVRLLEVSQVVHSQAELLLPPTVAMLGKQLYMEASIRQLPPQQFKEVSH
jgi:hypothetical protein